MKIETKPHLENLKTLRTRLDYFKCTRTLHRALKTLRSDLLTIKFPTPLGICCFVGNSGLLSTLAYHILGIEPSERGYWILPLEGGEYVTPVYDKEKRLIHPKTGIYCMDYYHEHHNKMKDYPDLPLQPLDLTRQKLVADVVELIDKLLQG